jgi:oxygen-independent coproporphyrinogen-3 oxidase
VLGLYLHIPFCSAICNYCNFNRGLLDDGLKARYVNALEREIRAAAEPSTPVDSIYFGGGTPSLLTAGEVARLVQACRESFSVAERSEVTLEANPETVTLDTLGAYRRAGVNRISFGVQSCSATRSFAASVAVTPRRAPARPSRRRATRASTTSAWT